MLSARLKSYRLWLKAVDIVEPIEQVRLISAQRAGVEGAEWPRKIKCLLLR